MSGYCDPPNRFSSTNQPKHHAGPRGHYLVPLLRKALAKKVNFQDPDTKRMIKIPVAEAIALRLIFNGLQGDIRAIKEIMDRVDGKVTQKSSNELYGTVVMMPTIKRGGKPVEYKIGDESCLFGKVEKDYYGKKEL